MKRFPYFTTLVVLFLIACGGTTIATTQPPPSPAPTDTLEPTFTPLPTSTFTPVPTETPDFTATAASQATEAAGTILSELDTLLAGTDIPYKDGSLAWHQSDPVTINMSGPQTVDNFQGIDKNFSAGNFIFKSDVTWNATGVIICGAIFRSEEDVEKGKQYEFYFYRLSGLPAYFIDVYESRNFLNTITDAKFSSELDVSNGATNSFVLIAQDNQFNVYLNGKRQGRYFDNSKQRAEGYFAFLAWQESGKGSCKFENSWIWVLK